MEINFFHGDPLALADEVFFFKRTVREAALRHDMYATFMAKPIAGEPGSAMHIHQSIVDKETGATCSATRTARRARSSSGTSAACRSTCRRRWRCSRPTSIRTAAWCARTAAPINIQWGTDNRTVGIRVPVAARGDAAHREPRHRRRRQPLPALAATLACGYLGIKQRIEPTPECKGDAYLGDFQLPRSLGEALRLLRAEQDLAEVLGEAFITVYTEVKEIEYAEFMKVISPWEREHLLLHV